MATETLTEINKLPTIRTRLCVLTWEDRYPNGDKDICQVVVGWHRTDHPNYGTGDDGDDEGRLREAIKQSHLPEGYPYQARFTDVEIPA